MLPAKQLNNDKKRNMKDFGSSKNLFFVTILVLVAIGMNASFSQAAPEQASQPNIIIFLADDLGIGDLHCYGNKTLRTPNIDSMAENGVLFDQMVSADPLCTPSRAALLTGRLPIRTGMAHIFKRLLVFPAEPGGLPQEEVTIAEILREVNYSTALIGKWHQGVNLNHNQDAHHLPNNQGFDYFYGLPLTLMRDCGNSSMVEHRFPQWRLQLFFTSLSLIIGIHFLFSFFQLSKKLSFFLCFFLLFLSLILYLLISTANRWICLLYRNNQLIEQPIQLDTLAPRLYNEAVNFIEKQVSSDPKKPFFLYYAFDMVHTPLSASPAFRGKSAHGLYGDVVEEMDHYVGQVIRNLRELQVLDNTLIFFSSDNGPFLEEEQEGGSAGIFSGGKGQTWEGGIRVPAVMMWPKRIPSGRRFIGSASLMDLFVTSASAAGASHLIPNDRVIDGIDLLPFLASKEGEEHNNEKEKEQEEEEEKKEVITIDGDSERFQYHYCGSKLAAIRYGRRWKAHFMTQEWEDKEKESCPSTAICFCVGKLIKEHDPPILFDLELDPQELHPIMSTTGNATGNQMDQSNEETQVQVQVRIVLEKIMRAKEEHEKTLGLEEGSPLIRPKSQLNHLPRARLQPCCNFPYCNCAEGETST